MPVLYKDAIMTSIVITGLSNQLSPVLYRNQKAQCFLGLKRCLRLKTVKSTYYQKDSTVVMM